MVYPSGFSCHGIFGSDLPIILLISSPLQKEPTHKIQLFCFYASALCHLIFISSFPLYLFF